MMNSQAAKLLSHCPLCRQQYAEAAVQYLGEQKGAQVYHCSCVSCGHAMIAVILEQAGLVSSIGMVTDLEVSDALRFYKADPIQQDECVEIHRILEHHSQDLCSVLLA